MHDSVDIQKLESKVRTTRNPHPRNCALMATCAAPRGVSISEERPAAAAAASKWPMFDFNEVHCAFG